MTEIHSPDHLVNDVVDEDGEPYPMGRVLSADDYLDEAQESNEAEEEVNQ